MTLKDILTQASKEDLKMALQTDNELYQVIADMMKQSLPNYPPEIIHFRVSESLKNEVLERFLTGKF